MDLAGVSRTDLCGGSFTQRFGCECPPASGPSRVSAENPAQYGRTERLASGESEPIRGLQQRLAYREPVVSFEQASLVFPSEQRLRADGGTGTRPTGRYCVPHDGKRSGAVSARSEPN